MAESASAAAPVDPTVYPLRANAFVNRRLYRLTGDALTWEEEGKPLDGVFYDGIAEIRLAYTPTRLARNRYRAQIIFREGGMAELFNTDYRGIADFAEQNEEYAAFLRELHRRVAAAGKPVLYRQRNSMGGYIANMLLTVFIFAMIALAFVLLLTIGMIWIAVVKLMIVLYFIPTLIRYIKRAKPAEYDPLAIPDAVLPAVAPGGQNN
jgi:hypothetical protein